MRHRRIQQPLGRVQEAARLTRRGCVRRERGRPETERMRNEGDEDRTNRQVLGEQRVDRAWVVGTDGLRIAKHLVVAPSHWRLHRFILAWINFLKTLRAA